VQGNISVTFHSIKKNLGGSFPKLVSSQNNLMEILKILSMYLSHGESKELVYFEYLILQFFLVNKHFSHLRFVTFGVTLA